MVEKKARLDTFGASALVAIAGLLAFNQAGRARDAVALNGGGVGPGTAAGLAVPWPLICGGDVVQIFVPGTGARSWAGLAGAR